jgi:hypothetical protein
MKKQSVSIKAMTTPLTGRRLTNNTDMRQNGRQRAAKKRMENKTETTDCNSKSLNM